MFASTIQSRPLHFQSEGSGFEPMHARVRAIESGRGDTCSDALGLVMDLTGEVQSVANAYHSINASSKTMEILGFTSSLSIFTGPITIHRGWKEIQIAQIYQDCLAEIRGWLNTLYGALQTASGAVFAAMSTALMIFYETASKVAQRASNFFGQFAVGLTGASLLFGFLSKLSELPDLFHCGKMILSSDMESIVKEINDFALSKSWRNLLGGELLEKVRNGERINRSELFLSFAKEVLGLLLYLAGTVLSVIELFFAASFPPWILGMAGAVIGFLFLAPTGYDLIFDHGKHMETWEKVLVLISGIFCLGISLTAFQFAVEISEKIASLVAGFILSLVHLIVLVNNQKGETNS